MKVSIIIPAYNYAHFLRETLRDLLCQSHRDWECIVVDNASTDDTKAVVETFAKNDSRFKYLFNKKKGPSASRNIGIDRAEGDFIQFLDADDFLEHNKLKSAVEIFGENKEADIVYSDMRYFLDGNLSDLYYYMSLDKSNDSKWMSYVEGGRKEVLPALLTGNIMVISSPLIRRSSLQEVGLYDEELAFNEDWELWLRFAMKNKKFVYDPAPNTKTLIRVHKTSHSRDGYRMYYSGLKVCKRILAGLSKEENNGAFARKIQYHEMILKGMILKSCSEKNLTIERLNELTAISPAFEKMLKMTKKYPAFILRLLFYINYKSDFNKYQRNA